MDLSPDTQAILLLCSRFGQPAEDGADVLTARQYGTLAKWLKDQSLRPADLLDETGRAALDSVDASIIVPQRIRGLLERGTALGIAVERWFRHGLWVIGRSDPQYPAGFKSYLGSDAPPVIYGVGNAALLSRQGLAVVGSRDAAEEDLQFADRIARACARQRISVVSGAARGVDLTAMTAAYDEGGVASGVLADGLAKAAVSSRYREGLLSDRLVLVSTAEPEARWFVYAAMQRNKLIYALGAAALVVSSGQEEGGTWAGATEALRAGRIRVYVKLDAGASGGNRRLAKIGALPFPEGAAGDIAALFGPAARTADLFAAGNSHNEAQPAPAVPDEPPSQPQGHEAPQDQHPPTEPAVDSAVETSALRCPAAASRPAYDLVLPEMLRLLEEPREPEWLATVMEVQKKQLDAWLKRALDERVVRKLSKPVRYVAVSAQNPLFSESKR